MGYDIFIGQVKGKFRITNGMPDLKKAEVIKRENPDAPLFPNDTMTGQSNMRCPSYTSWHNCMEVVGLKDLFWDTKTGIMRKHPGTFLLTKNHAEQIRQALKAYRQKYPDVQPGFSGFRDENPEYGDENAIFARLIWLDYWVNWAVENCELPAIQNF